MGMVTWEGSHSFLLYYGSKYSNNMGLPYSWHFTTGLCPSLCAPSSTYVRQRRGNACRGLYRTITRLVDAAFVSLSTFHNIKTGETLCVAHPHRSANAARHLRAASYLSANGCPDALRRHHHLFV